nr:retrovirus-related Pol polyprotein from transposon TNT 1-94 [Tanacetum cinerariifolium]
MALTDEELIVGKNHARNGEWIDITMRKRHIKERIWYLDSGCSRSINGVKSYLHKYVEKPHPKVTFDESMEAIRFTNTPIHEIGINDSSRYHPVEFLQEDDPSRKYKSNSDFSYHIIPYGYSLTKLTKDAHVPKMITSNEQNTPHTENVEGNNAETSVPITEPLVPEVP